VNDHAGVVRIARHQAAEGRRDEVAGLLKAAAESMRDAPGCFGAQVMSSDRKQEQLILVSRWQSVDAMDKYNARPEFAGFQREIMSSLEGAPDVEILTRA
jgi:quinol monooxygenase YgiN